MPIIEITLLELQSLYESGSMPKEKVIKILEQFDKKDFIEFFLSSGAEQLQEEDEDVLD